MFMVLSILAAVKSCLTPFSFTHANRHIPMYKLPRSEQQCYTSSSSSLVGSALKTFSINLSVGLSGSPTMLP